MWRRHLPCSGHQACSRKEGMQPGIMAGRGCSYLCTAKPPALTTCAGHGIAHGSDYSSLVVLLPIPSWEGQHILETALQVLSDSLTQVAELRGLRISVPLSSYLTVWGCRRHLNSSFLFLFIFLINTTLGLFWHLEGRHCHCCCCYY